MCSSKPSGFCEDSRGSLSIPTERLERAFADETADIELRAGAAHALLAFGDEALVSRVALAIGASAPPLVVAAAALAAPSRVARALVDEALLYLPLADRRAFSDATTTTSVAPEPDSGSESLAPDVVDAHMRVDPEVEGETEDSPSSGQRAQDVRRQGR